MQRFEYSLPMRVLYRYGNLPVSVILLFYLFGAAANLDKSLLNLIPLVIAALLLYFLNKHYLMLYKILPYTIEADSVKLKCSNFIFSKKEIIIYYKDIDKLAGGIFEAKISSLMKICDGQRNLCVGFFTTIKNSKTLQTLILSKVNKNLYDEIISRLRDRKVSQEKSSRPVDTNKSKKTDGNK